MATFKLKLTSNTVDLPITPKDISDVDDTLKVRFKRLSDLEREEAIKSLVGMEDEGYKKLIRDTIVSFLDVRTFDENNKYLRTIKDTSVEKDEEEGSVTDLVFEMLWDWDTYREHLINAHRTLLSNNTEYKKAILDMAKQGELKNS